MRRPRLRWARRAATIVVFALVVEYLVLPQIPGTRSALHLLGGVEPWWLVLGVGLEAASLVSYSLFTRSALPPTRPTYGWLIRTDVTALGVGHIVPGGTATAAGVRYRLLRQGGAAPADAALLAAAQGVGSTLVLVAILWVALVASIPFVGVHAVYIWTATASAVVIAASVTAVIALTRGSVPTRHVLHRVVAALPQRWQPRVRRSVDTATTQLLHLLANRHALKSAALWSAMNWLLDAASLWVFIAAFGHQMDPIALLVGYGLASLAAVVPVSPGGLGVVEGVLIPSLVGFSVPAGIAVLGVVSWRLFEFWAPIPVAGLCYASLRTQKWWARHGHRAAWAEFASFFKHPREVAADPVPVIGDPPASSAQ